MMDYKIDDVINLPFTTRAFATGVPTVLAGSPTVELYEDASVTPIVEGAGKLVLTISLNGIAGFNIATATLSAANGFEIGKHYTLVIKTGTVGGTSVVGEVVYEFTIQFMAPLTNITAASGIVLSCVTHTGAVIPTVSAVTGLTASDVGAIKAKTDSLTFTKAGEVDSNLQSVNGVTVNGDGAGTPMGV